MTTKMLHAATVVACAVLALAALGPASAQGEVYAVVDPAAAVIGESTFSLGGMVLSDTGFEPTTAVYRADASGVAAIGSLAEAVADASALVNGTHVWVFGGAVGFRQVPTTTVQWFDTATNASGVFTEPLAVAVSDAAAAAIGNAIFVLGGDAACRAQCLVEPSTLIQRWTPDEGARVMDERLQWAGPIAHIRQISPETLLLFRETCAEGEPAIIRLDTTTFASTPALNDPRLCRYGASYLDDDGLTRILGGSNPGQQPGDKTFDVHIDATTGTLTVNEGPPLSAPRSAGLLRATGPSTAEIFGGETLCGVCGGSSQYPGDAQARARAIPGAPVAWLVSLVTAAALRPRRSR